MKVKGQNIRLFIGDKCIAAATSCTLHIAANLEDSSTKDSTGDWQEQECTGKSWDFSGEMVVVDADTGGVTALDAAEMVGKTVTAKFSLTNGAQNRVESKAWYEGEAIINDWSLSAQNRQNATVSVQGQGVGELKKQTE